MLNMLGNSQSLLLNTVRYGLVVRIAGSHPAGPGSIPGNGILFVFVFSQQDLTGPHCISEPCSFQTRTEVSGASAKVVVNGRNGKKITRRGWDSNPRGQSPLD